MAAKKRKSGPSGRTKTARERVASGLARLEVYLSREAGDALDALVIQHGTKRAAVEAALLCSGRKKAPATP